MRRLGRLGLAVVLVLFVGCGDDGSTGTDAGGSDSGMMMDVGTADTGTADTGTADTGTTDTGTTDTGMADTGTTDTGMADTGTADTGVLDAGMDAGSGPQVESEPNDDFGTANPMGLNVPMAGVIDPAGDDDFFSFQGTAGTWLRIATSANPMDSPTGVDTVITLYDSTMTQIAEADDQIPRVNTDSELYTLLPSTGTYYIRVQEFSEWNGDPAEGDPSFDYLLGVIEVDFGVAVNTLDPENGDTLAEATAYGVVNGNLGLGFGLMDAVDDVDPFTFTVPAGATRNVSVNLGPPGPSGFGSTSALGDVWIADASGSTIIARVNQTAGQGVLAPPLDPGDYTLFIGQNGNALGAHDFWFTRLRIRDETNQPEADSAANDAIAGSQTLTIGPAFGLQGALVTGHLDSDADVDHYSFDMTSGQQVLLLCDSRTTGSGNQDLSVEAILPDQTTVLSSATEGAAVAAFSPFMATTMAGTHYFRVSKVGQDATVTGDWYRCAFVIR